MPIHAHVGKASPHAGSLRVAAAAAQGMSIYTTPTKNLLLEKARHPQAR